MLTAEIIFLIYKIFPSQAKYYEAETIPRIKHTKQGLIMHRGRGQEAGLRQYRNIIRGLTVDRGQEEQEHQQTK